MQIFPERTLVPLEFLTKAGGPLQGSEGLLGEAEWGFGGWAQSLLLSKGQCPEQDQRLPA